MAKWKITSEDLDNQIDATLITAVEYGYKACEKGWNLEQTMQEFKKLLTTERR